MTIYRCNKCGKETNQVHLNKVNEGMELCDDCFPNYKKELEDAGRKYDLEVIKIEQKYA